MEGWREGGRYALDNVKLTPQLASGLRVSANFTDASHHIIRSSCSCPCQLFAPPGMRGDSRRKRNTLLPNSYYSSRWKQKLISAL